MWDHCTVTWVLHPGGEAWYYLSLVQVHGINIAQLWEPGSCNANISQVTPLLGTTPCETSQLRNTNTQEDVEEILGTTTFQRYVETPIQTLDGIIVNQLKRFLPLVQEARKITEEISELKKLMNSGPISPSMIS